VVNSKKRQNIWNKNTNRSKKDKKSIWNKKS
jgi:hypothetical protein